MDTFDWISKRVIVTGGAGFLGRPPRQADNIRGAKRERPADFFSNLMAGTNARLTDCSGRLVWDASKPAGRPRRKPDVRQSAALFGFRAHTSFEDARRRTVEWDRARAGG